MTVSQNEKNDQTEFAEDPLDFVEEELYYDFDKAYQEYNEYNTKMMQVTMLEQALESIRHIKKVWKFLDENNLDTSNFDLKDIPKDIESSVNKLKDNELDYIEESIQAKYNAVKDVRPDQSGITLYEEAIDIINEIILFEKQFKERKLKKTIDTYNNM